jgi:DNA invertase Pin-like site-specific DNA recombinase
MSTDLQKYSTENQLETIRRYAEQRGYTIVHVFEDSGRSGLRMDGRDGLQSPSRARCAAHPDCRIFQAYRRAELSSKSTLIKRMNGLEKFDSGSVVVDGVAVGKSNFEMTRLRARRQPLPSFSANFSLHHFNINLRWVAMTWLPPSLCHGGDGRGGSQSLG